MTIKDLGARVVSVWEGLRPMTQKMLVGAFQNVPTFPIQKFSYDAHADWELSRLLGVLDERANEFLIQKDVVQFDEVKKMADTCALVLQAQTESAEIFIQLAERALKKADFARIDKLADALSERFSVGEMCEIVRQTNSPAIRALAIEALSVVPAVSLIPLLDDPIYEDIAHFALEQQAFEYESEQARQILDALEMDELGDE